MAVFSKLPLSTVSFEHDGHHYRRTTFASMPDSIIVMRLEADATELLLIAGGMVSQRGSIVFLFVEIGGHIT
ncbi:MAG: glycoside hydrolase N-terminal domain-containing protein, partial [Oscillospiraceae bacterium]|nr:glycoside hydrolase N-terminal domain-containing protein [Oscillospiraceae bacterium]